MDYILEELRCPICLDLFTAPIVLPCSHVLCQEPCASRLFHSGFIRCPVCRDTSFVIGGLRTLPRVISLDHIIQVCKEAQLKRKAETPTRVVDSTEDGPVPSDVSTMYSSSLSRVSPVSEARCLTIDAPLSGTQIDHPSLVCDVCTEDPPLPVYLICRDCRSSYCRRCLHRTHPNTTPYNEHDLYPPPIMHDTSNTLEDHDLMMDDSETEVNDPLLHHQK